MRKSQDQSVLEAAIAVDGIVYCGNGDNAPGNPYSPYPVSLGNFDQKQQIENNLA